MSDLITIKADYRDFVVIGEPQVFKWSWPEYMRPKVLPKRSGRIGTRKAWKRAHPPGLYHVTTLDDGSEWAVMLGAV